MKEDLCLFDFLFAELILIDVRFKGSNELKVNEIFHHERKLGEKLNF